MNYLYNYKKIRHFGLGLLLACNLAAQQDEGLKLDSSSYSGNLRYNQVCWLTAHNAFANRDEFWTYTNQNLSFEAQYAYGVRAFMLDLYWHEVGPFEWAVALCHELSPEAVTATGKCVCTLPFRFPEGPQELKIYFFKIKEWLDANPDEIITLFLESRLGKTGGQELKRLLKETGLEDYLYINKFPEYFSVYNNIPNWPGTHRRTKGWPTLAEIRQKNGRLVIFSDNLDDEMFSPISYGESKYDLATAPKCEIRRFYSNPKYRPLLLMNHFYSFSLLKKYENVNSFEALIERAQWCYDDLEIWPNFIAVDFVEMGKAGGAKAAVIKLNKELNPAPENNLKSATSTSSSSLASAPNSKDEL